MGKLKYNRILVCGNSSCAGKNWFGERLAKKIGVKFYDTDDMAWIKRFTVRRDYDEKSKMLKEVAKKDNWVIVTGATSYVEPAQKRAELIIILKVGWLRSTYRILRRNHKHEKMKIEKSMYSPLELAKMNFKDHWKKNGRLGKKIEEVIDKYPDKVLILNQRQKNKFLKEFRP